jgi:predicted DNA-binding transcriptional regulator AlpA
MRREAKRSPSEIREWLAAAPRGTLVEAQALALALAEADEGQPEGSAPQGGQVVCWRERLWTAPADTRIGVAELCEALGRTKSWVWRHTGPRSTGPRLPHRKLDGALVFVVVEVRAWLREHERIIVVRPTSLVLPRPRSASR